MLLFTKITIFAARIGVMSGEAIGLSVLLRDTLRMKNETNQ